MTILGVYISNRVLNWLMVLLLAAAGWFYYRFMKTGKRITKE